ncbi:MAG TPA: sigma-70 family RNA polymerase sigma factor [Armatimonadota bacterium]|nr:sigma-70 family RNA polymerase sigma factor [Armatimonadota bacterium]
MPIDVQYPDSASQLVWHNVAALLLAAFGQEAALPRPNIDHTYDRQLVDRAQLGDHGAFRQLFEAYSPLIYRICYRMVGSPDDAADLTQDVFVRAFERLHTLKDGQAFHAWITRLAVNMAHDRARRRRLTIFSLNAPPPAADDSVEWQVADDTPHHDARILSEELSAHVQQALMSLSPDHRMVVVLHHLEGIDVEEISRIVGVPAGTVKSRLSRARAELKRKLEGYLEE